MSGSKPRRIISGAWVFVFAMGLLLANLAAVRPAYAADLTAGNYADLVTAITTANGNGLDDTITLTADITLAGVLPPISGNITFQGNNHKVDGVNTYQIFTVTSGGVNFYDMTITGGTSFSGAAINNLGGTVGIQRSTLTNNTATGVISLSTGGAIFNIGVLNIGDSTLSNNKAINTTALLLPAGGFGGAIYSAGTLSIVNTTFSNNVAQATSSIASTAFGGAIASVGGSTFLVNTTFSGNQANADGSPGAINAVAFGGAISANGTVKANNLTIAGNSATASGASTNSAEGMNISTTSTFTLTNSIVTATGINSCQGTITDGGNNIQTPDTSCGATIPVADPLLDPAGLKNNGGLTQTIALLPGSPAINAGNPGECIPIDQRNFAREGICDIGAFEYITPPVVVKNGAPPPADLIGQLRITPDRLATTDSQNPIGYIFTVKNIGQGEASAVSFELPVDPNLVVGYTEFNDPETWVSSVTTASVSISLPNLTNGEVVSGTIFFRPNTAPAPTAGTEVTSRYTLKFTNPDGSDKTVWSNAASTEFGGTNTDVSQGMVQLMMADAPDGSKITYHSHFWIPNETVTAWITWPDGVTSKELKVAPADADGHFMVEVDAAALGLEPGSYVIAAHGARSEIYGSGVLVVSASGSSSAKPATGLGLKSLGAKALVAPKSR